MHYIFILFMRKCVRTIQKRETDNNAICERQMLVSTSAFFCLFFQVQTNERIADTQQINSPQCMWNSCWNRVHYRMNH